MAYFKSTLYNSNNQLDFEVSPDLGEKTGREFANQMSESLGGVEYVFQPHSGKRTWSFNWSNISSTFQGQLKDFRESLEIINKECKDKKLPFNIKKEFLKLKKAKLHQ